MYWPRKIYWLVRCSLSWQVWRKQLEETWYSCHNMDGQQWGGTAVLQGGGQNSIRDRPCSRLHWIREHSRLTVTLAKTAYAAYNAFLSLCMHRSVHWAQQHCGQASWHGYLQCKITYLLFSTLIFIIQPMHRSVYILAQHCGQRWILQCIIYLFDDNYVGVSICNHACDRNCGWRLATINKSRCRITGAQIIIQNYKENIRANKYSQGCYFTEYEIRRDRKERKVSGT